MIDDVSANEPTSRLAAAAAEAFQRVYHTIAPHRQRQTMETVAQVLDAHEEEMRPIVAGVFRSLADVETLPDEMRQSFARLADPEHFAQASILLVGIYPIVSGFIGAAIAPYTQDIANLAWHDHPSAVLSPAELALALLRSEVGADWAANEARKSGLHPDSFAILETITGEPPGIMQLLELYRRDLIDDARLVRGILQSRVRNEWVDAVRDLRYAPPTPGEVVMGVVKGHLADADGAKLFAEGGIDPKHYEWVRDTAGRPPGTVEMLQLLNRRQIDEGMFGDAVRQSDVQNRWIPQLLELRWYVPPPRSVVNMLHQGAVTDARAAELLAEHGVRPEDIPLYIAEGHHSRATATKGESVAQVRSEYDAGMIDEPTAVAAIEAHGYTPDEAARLIDLTNRQRVKRARDSAVSHLHTLFVHHKLAQSDLSNELDRLGVQSTVRDDLVRLWLLERDATVSHLTTAQNLGAWRRGVMTSAELETRLVALGYSPEDVPYLEALAFPPTRFPNGRTIADIGH